MKSSSVILVLLAATASFFTSSAQARLLASGRVGNGGYAYVCRDATSGAITSARLLDLWEAEGVPTWKKDDSVDAQIAAVLGKIKSYSPNAAFVIGGNLEVLRDEKTIAYSQRSLEATEDAFPSFKPAPGCGYEQVARYEPVLSETGQQGLRVASEIFHSPHFSNTDRAALFVHEAIYLLDREWNEATNSQRSRMIVAHLFSDSVIPNAVRMATTLIGLGAKLRADSQVVPNTPKTLLAVPDPLAVGFEIRFSEVDGVQAYVGKPTAIQKAARYRCTATSGPSPEASTGWVKLEDLVRENPFTLPRLEKGVKIAGNFLSLEYLASGERPEGATMQNLLYIECERRTEDGKKKIVQFRNALLRFDPAVSLTLTETGALKVKKGRVERTLSSIRNIFFQEGHWAVVPLEIVRGIF